MLAGSVVRIAFREQQSCSPYHLRVYAMAVNRQLFGENDRETAQTVITRLLQSRNANGWPLSFQHMLDIKAVSALSREGLGDGDISAVLQDMLAKGLATTEEFEAIWTRRCRTALQVRGPEWTFFLPLDATLAPEITGRVSIRVLDSVFRLVHWQTAVNRIGKRALARAISLPTHNRAPKSPGACFIVKAAGAGWGAAWARVDPAFDLLRGIIEITYGFGRMTLRTPEGVRAALLCPSWFLAKQESGEVECSRFIVEDDPCTRKAGLEIQAEDLATIKRNARPHRRQAPEDSTTSLLADCLRLYVQAMDARFGHWALLGFWQVAEAITLSREVNADTRSVCARLKAILPTLRIGAEGLGAVLLHLADKRNDIVHRGIRTGDYDEDINILKTVCEGAITTVRAVRDKKGLPTKAHLRHFYQLHSSCTATLKAITESLDFVQRSRRARVR